MKQSSLFSSKHEKSWMKFGQTNLFLWQISSNLVEFKNRQINFWFVHVTSSIPRRSPTYFFSEKNLTVKCINIKSNSGRHKMYTFLMLWLYPVGYFLIWQPCNLLWAWALNLPTPLLLWPLGLTDQDSTLGFLYLNYFWRQLLC